MSRRKLAAILVADVVGYSRLVAQDEEGTVARLKAYRRIIDSTIASYHGRVFGSAGDSIIAEFASPVEAVRCAVETQRRIEQSIDASENTRRMLFRIGLNVGDVMVEAGDLLGDGVNIAARLERLADAGGICISEEVHRHVAAKIDLAFDDLGQRSLKNIPTPVHVYRVRMDTG
jgi:adenylate cyclase